MSLVKDTLRLYVGRLILSITAIFLAVVVSLWAVEAEKHQGLVLDAQTTHFVTLVPKRVLQTPDGELRYYFEPEPYETWTDRADWLPSETTVHFNNEGLNNTSDFSVEKPKETFRIVVLGDSFTYGLYVNSVNNYVSVLSSLLSAHTCSGMKHYELLNLGVPSFDIQYEVERFARHGAKYRPDLVIWLINYHNVLQIRELLTPLEEKIMKETSTAAKAAYEAKNEFYFAAALAMDKVRAQYGDEGIFAEQQKFLNRFSSMYNGKLAIFMFSSAEPKTKSVIRAYAGTRWNSYFFDDLTDITGQYALRDSHPNASGHTMIAREMFERLSSQHLLPCQ